MIPGSGQGGAGSGAGPAGGGVPFGGIFPPGPGSGGSGNGGEGGSGSGGGLPRGRGGSSAYECGELTPMHTYFTVNCHYHSESRDKNTGEAETEDITLSGDIPIEMVREWDNTTLFQFDTFSSEGGKLNYEWMRHHVCGDDEKNCGDCKYTYSGPAYGGAEIDQVSPVSVHQWTAHFVFEGPRRYADWISLFDPNNYSPFDCPPRLGWYSVTGEAGPKIPPLDVRQALSGCTDDYSQEEMNHLAENMPSFCEPLEDPQFILRDGEVITFRNSDKGDDYQVSTDATYAFHISAR